MGLIFSQLDDAAKVLPLLKSQDKSPRSPLNFLLNFENIFYNTVDRYHTFMRSLYKNLPRTNFTG